MISLEYWGMFWSSPRRIACHSSPFLGNWQPVPWLIRKRFIKWQFINLYILQKFKYKIFWVFRLASNETYRVFFFSLYTLNLSTILSICLISALSVLLHQKESKMCSHLQLHTWWPPRRTHQPWWGGHSHRWGFLWAGTDNLHPLLWDYWPMSHDQGRLKKKKASCNFQTLIKYNYWLTDTNLKVFHPS